ncbi:hypothetical protein [Limnoraphis robusta]|uniref:hypothetical protein n=1 Tax=Limnoraphis robusta TaxID=1118279 RepID=UPI002B1FBD8A|nr:hypothetical protein [Limnoraphis robusta]MEA5498200.1 hypothetical protein [Limnoraphis robusta BA-68 BA1]
MSASAEGWLASAGTVVALLGGIVSIVAAVGHADFPVGVRRTAHAVVGAGVCILAVALIVYLARDTDDAAVVTSPTSVLARSGVPCPARGVFEAARAAADTFEFDRLPNDGSEVILQVVREPTRPDAEGNYKNYVVQICREFDGDLFYVSWQTEEPLEGVVAPADVDGVSDQ